jgi:hypothetical protein
MPTRRFSSSFPYYHTDHADEYAELLETRLTTIAGAVALLTYYVDVTRTTQPEVVFPEPDGNGWQFESKSIDKPRKDFVYFIVRNVAAALSNMATAAVMLMNSDLVAVTV